MSNDSLKVFLWIFGGILYVFTVFALYLKSGRNGNDLPIAKRKELWWQNLILNSLFCLPVPLIFTYKAYGDTLNSEVLFFISLPIVVFALCYEFLYSQPRISQLTADADKLFKTLKLDASEDKYSFNAEDVQILVHNDVALSSRYNGIDNIQIDRLCKNSFGEYFWVRAKLGGFSKPEIIHFSIQAAMNFLRAYPKLYQQEFNEENK
ncbi:MAG: hypothetical protein ABL920_10270 [Methylotenera sp.]